MASDDAQDQAEALAEAVKDTGTSTHADHLEQTSPTEAPTLDTVLDRTQKANPETAAIPAGLPGLALPANRDSSVKLAELEGLTELTVMDLEEQERQGFPARYGSLPRWQPEQYGKGWWSEGDNRSYPRRRHSDDWSSSVRRREPGGAASRDSRWGSPIRRREPGGAASWDSGWDDNTIDWRGHTADGWNMPAVPEEDEERHADHEQEKGRGLRPGSNSEESADATREGESEVPDKKEQDRSDGYSRK